jgi:hypothetical protein
VAGIKGSGNIPVSLAVDAQEEPNTRRKQPPSRMKATVYASELTVGGKYEMCRFEGTSTLPTEDSNGCVGARDRVPFTATNTSWSHRALLPVLSNTATYFRVFPK